ncbi:hypothetical protein HYS29_00100 [Candidatus Microgenomates bacterium]|nr:hypothetical protein [Candidatus Microgenomates bacterium]MBI2622067.1 hypothetical protein [Candidatus Microgenomates bacterium]
METTFFWIVWIIIASWLLRTFYFSYKKNKAEQLWLVSLGINFLVFLLFFLPWMPKELGGKTGWELFSSGNLFVTIMLLLLALTEALLITKQDNLIKLATLTHVSNSVVFIFGMTRILPGTFTLQASGLAAIIAALLLLVGNVTMLFLHQQLELKRKTARRKKRSKRR